MGIKLTCFQQKSAQYALLRPGDFVLRISITWLYTSAEIKKIKFYNLNWKNLFLDILMWLLVLNECLEHASLKRMKYRTDTRGTVPSFACFFQLRVDQWLIQTSIIPRLYFCLASSHLLQVTCRWSRRHRTSCTSLPCQPSPSYGILPVCCTQGTRILHHRSLFWL